MKYQNMIGDGKTPNYYWVFQYDEKFKREGNELISLNPEVNETKDNLLGRFKTFQEALNCVNYKAYLPHIVIEDRISGQIFETICIVCPCCGKEKWETRRDEGFTKKTMEEMGLNFI